MRASNPNPFPSCSSSVRVESDERVVLARHRLASGWYARPAVRTLHDAILADRLTDVLAELDVRERMADGRCDRAELFQSSGQWPVAGKTRAFADH